MASLHRSQGPQDASRPRDDGNLRLMGTARNAWPESPGQERNLVDRMRAGEEGAFEVFADCYIPALYRFAGRRLNHDRELTKEMVQSTLCKVIEKLDSYRAEAPLLTWLCACCKNEIAAHYRRMGRRPREVELDEASAETTSSGGILRDPPAGLEQRLEQGEMAERVHVALDQLPPGYARAMEWRYLEDLPVTEIARRLESSYKAAESLLSRAREAFRVAYENLGTEGRTVSAPREGIVR